MPRASEHIAEDIEIIKILEAKGIAYRTSDGIYFDTSKSPAYGTRGGFKLGELKEGVRVAVNEEKRNARDFSLWKFSKGEIGFESPWGKGFPGWHIECSAMSRKYLGQPFDIHTGGIDHIPVHHQNEIAQSEAAYDTPLANLWMHNEYLNMGSEKMAKSGDNFITLQTLKDRGIHPLAFRYLLLQTHYRSPLNFSWEALEAAQRAYFRVLLAFSRLAKRNQAKDTEKSMLGDDLNTPALLASLGTLFKKQNRAAILDADRVLGLDIENQAQRLRKEMQAVPAEIKKLVDARERARSEEDWKKADAFRDEVRAGGFEIMDTDEGPILRPRDPRAQ